MQDYVAQVLMTEECLILLVISKAVPWISRNRTLDGVNIQIRLTDSPLQWWWLHENILVNKACKHARIMSNRCSSLTEFCSWKEMRWLELGALLAPFLGNSLWRFWLNLLGWYSSDMDIQCAEVKGQQMTLSHGQIPLHPGYLADANSLWGFVLAQGTYKSSRIGEIRAEISSYRCNRKQSSRWRVCHIKETCCENVAMHVIAGHYQLYFLLETQLLR